MYIYVYSLFIYLIKIFKQRLNILNSNNKKIIYTYIHIHIMKAKHQNYSLNLWVDNVDNIISSSEDVRNLSYQQVINNGLISKQQQTIIDYLSTHQTQGSTFNDICRDTGLRISSVTARINELRKKEIVYLYGKTIDPQTNKLNCLWNLKEYQR